MPSTSCTPESKSFWLLFAVGESEKEALGKSNSLGVFTALVY